VSTVTEHDGIDGIDGGIRPSPSGAEAPTTLLEAAPRTLGLLDQLGFWGNLGVSLLGFAGALSILTPYGAGPLSLPAAVTAIVVGSVIGGLMLGPSLMLGQRTGAPAMVLMRGLLGAKASFLPTVLNIAQCLGWAVFELVVIATGLQTLAKVPHWAAVLLAGLVTTGLTIRPLGAIRVLRKYVSVLVVLALVVLVVGLLRHPAAHVSGTWGGFWLAVDAAVALTISWVPLGADYSRHARSGRSAFAGGFAGYGATQVLCLLIGVLALSEVRQDPNRIFDLFLSLPLGTAAFAVLVLRETDQSFANVYSTAMSIQNMAPRWDRRVLTVAIGALTVVVALTLDINAYTNFLYLIGAVFIPLTGALIACWVRLRGTGWNTTPTAPLRPAMLAAWAAGFVVYQLVNPGAIPHWSDFWTTAGTHLHTLGHPWLSASLAAFAVALLVALPFARPATPTPLEPARAARAEG
jgi:NCS1 family nucleobase:cation symporter-1